MQNIVHIIELNKIVKEDREEFISKCMDDIVDRVSSLRGTIKLYTKKQREKIFKKNFYLKLFDYNHDSLSGFVSDREVNYFSKTIFTSEDLAGFIAKMESYGVQVTYHTVLEDMGDLLYYYRKHTEEILCVDLKFTKDYYKKGFYQMCSEQGKKEYNKYKGNNKIKEWGAMLNRSGTKDIYVERTGIRYYQGGEYKQIIFEKEGYKNLDKIDIFSVVLFNFIDNLDKIRVNDWEYGYEINLYKEKIPMPEKKLKDW